MKIFLIFIIFAQFAWAKCIYVPCNSVVQSGKEKVQSILKSEFSKAKKELKNLKKEYEELFKKQKIINENLNIQIALLKKKSLQTKQVLFLLKKIIALQANKNSIKAQQ